MPIATIHVLESRYDERRIGSRRELPSVEDWRNARPSHKHPEGERRCLTCTSEVIHFTLRTTSARSCS